MLTDKYKNPPQDDLVNEHCREKKQENAEDPRLQGTWPYGGRASRLAPGTEYKKDC